MAEPVLAEPIAIVGMACVLPGARNLDAFLANLVGGVDAITDVPPGRWDREFYDPTADAPDRFYCCRGGFVDDVVEFDPTAFGIMPLAVEGAEPDQLVALAVAARALADAGNPHQRLDPAKVGVIVGRGGYPGSGQRRLEQRVAAAEQLVVSLHALLPELPAERLAAVKADFTARLGPVRPESAIDLVPNLTASRISNRLDLRGPSYTVDAACASSLIAADQAIDQLASGRCDAVVTGGVHHCHDLTLWSVFTQLGAISRSQRLRAFDVGADGLLIGEGTAMVVLRRLRDAEADGDRVYAVLRGSGVASDGRSTSLMSPSPDGQVLAVERAWAASGRDPGRVGLIEAHGTATPAGDAAELETLRRVFGPAQRSGERPGLGSVKSMIGHAMPAAGAAGLVKTALAVFHGVLPPTLHVDEPNPLVAQTRFRLVTDCEPWEPAGPRLAGIDAFGFGGINAHLVLEEHLASTGRSAGTTAGFTAGFTASRSRMPLVHPHDAASTATSTVGERRGRLALEQVSGPDGDRETVLAIAGRDAAEVAALLRDVDPATEGPDVATVGTGPCRLVVVDPTPRRLALSRAVVERGRLYRGRGDVWFSPEPLLGADSGGGLLAFVFPGLEPDLAPRVDDIARLVGMDARRVVIGSDRLEVLGPAVIDAGRIVWAALRRAGVRPDACAGHSVGEWTAQIVTGMTPAVALEPMLDQLADVRLHHPDVAYLALGCGIDVAGALLAGVGDTVVSHDNCPHQTVVCGPDASIAIISERAVARGVIAQGMPFRSGFHTPMFEPYLSGMRQLFGALPIERPEVPVWSATTGEPYPTDPEAVRALTVAHLTRPVRFRGCVHRLHEHGARVFVQAGCGSVAGFIGDTLGDRQHLAVETNTAKRSGLAQFRRALGALWCVGADVALREPQPQASQGRRVGGRAAMPLRLGAPLVRGLTPIEPRALPHAPLHDGAAALAASGDRELVGSAPLLAALRSVLDETATASRDVMESWSRRDAVPLPMSAPMPGPAARAMPPTAPPRDALVRRETFSLLAQPAYADHAIFSQPQGWPDQSDRFSIVPLTAMVELFAERARELRPDLVVVGLEDVRASRWLVVEPATTTMVRVELAGVGHAADGLVRVRAAIDGHARATVLLAPRYPEAPRATIASHGHDSPLPFPPAAIYADRWLFHGPAYQAIASIGGWDAQGIVGDVTRLPAPGALLDSAGQVVGLWVALALDDRRTVLPTTVRRIAFFGDTPPVGSRVACRVTATSVDDEAVVADIELSVGQSLWARIEGWTERRFDVTNRLFELIRSPQDHVLATFAPGGWAWVQETWLDPASREMTMRRYLNAAERADYDRRNPRAQRATLLGRIAAKDLLRQRRWARGSGPIFPAEITVANDAAGRPIASGAVDPGLHVSIAHSAGLGAAVCGDVPVGIDVEAIAERPDGFADLIASAAERRLIDAIPGPPAVRLTTAWTVKEAAAKAGGSGLMGRPRSFEIAERVGDAYRVADRWLATARLTPPPNPHRAEETSYVVAWTR